VINAQKITRILPKKKTIKLEESSLKNLFSTSLSPFCKYKNLIDGPKLYDFNMEGPILEMSEYRGTINVIKPITFLNNKGL